MNYFALRSNGYLEHIGQYDNFDAAAEFCDKEFDGVVWIVDGATAKQWALELVNYLIAI
jgi:hypothetical protein